jgi:transcription initiation factor TFIIB
MKIRVPLPVPSNSISRIAGKAKLSEKTARKALELLASVVDSAMLSGKNPVSLAAAALYLATIETKEYTTQLRIAIAADVSTVTVRKRCLEIIQLVKQSNPELLTSLESTDKLLSAIKDHEPSRIASPEALNKSNRGLFLASKESDALSDLPM